MKFVKRNQINSNNVKDNSVAVAIDAPNYFDATDPGGDTSARDERIVMDVTNSLRLPKGTTNERPSAAVLTEGMIRYNTTLNELEAYQDGSWRRIRFKEPTVIHQQDIGAGDDVEIYFGPLDSTDPLFPYPELTAPENILVLVENVFQISTTNYELVDLDGINNPGDMSGGPSAAFYGGAGVYPAGRYVKFLSEIPYGKPVTVIHGFDR
jgi:hypothetical protein